MKRCKREIHRLCGWELGDQATNEQMTPGMTHGFQMAGRGMRQSSELPEAPEGFSKFSDGLDQYGK